jgi:hypothetical protein
MQAEEQVLAEEQTPAEEQTNDEEKPLISAEEPKQEDKPDEEKYVHHLQKDEETISTKEEEKVEVKEKPEYLNEQYFDEKTGDINTEQMQKDIKSLRDKMSAGKHKPPKDGNYDTEFYTKNYKKGSDDLFDEFIDFAKDNNMSQELVEKTFGMFQKAVGVIDDEVEQKGIDARKQLGKNADTIIANTQNWLDGYRNSKVINQEEMESISRASTDPHFVNAMNKIRRSYGEPNIPTTEILETGKMTLDKAKEMLKDPRYAAGDESYMRQVEQAFYEASGEPYPG